MTRLVIDASVVLAWLLPDETSSVHARSLADSAARDGAIVPNLWRLEVVNGLLMAVRRGRLAKNLVGEKLSTLARMPIAIDAETGAHAWSATLDLATRHALTAYEGAYLELALRTRLPLASFDANLTKAARAEGVEVV